MAIFIGKHRENSWFTTGFRVMVVINGPSFGRWKRIGCGGCQILYSFEYLSFFLSILGMIGCDDGHISGGLKTTNQISIYLHISQRCLMILWPFLVATSVCSGSQWERGIYAPFFCSHVTWIRCVKAQRWTYGSTLKRMGPPIEHGWCEVEGYRCLWYFIGLDGSRIIKLSGSPVQ